MLVISLFFTAWSGFQLSRKQFLICFSFVLICSVIGKQISRHYQPMGSKRNPIMSCSPAFSRVLRRLPGSSRCFVFCDWPVQLLWFWFYDTQSYSNLFLLLVFVDVENGRISGEDQEVVDQLEGKLNAINKSATDVYNSIISNAQVMCCILYSTD